MLRLGSLTGDKPANPEHDLPARDRLALVPEPFWGEALPFKLFLAIRFERKGRMSEPLMARLTLIHWTEYHSSLCHVVPPFMRLWLLVGLPTCVRKISEHAVAPPNKVGGQNRRQKLGQRKQSHPKQERQCKKADTYHSGNESQRACLNHCTSPTKLSRIRQLDTINDNSKIIALCQIARQFGIILL